VAPRSPRMTVLSFPPSPSVTTERDKKDVETLIEIWLGKYQCVATDDPRLKEKWLAADLTRKRKRLGPAGAGQ
jgi:hypothetical protein